MTVSEFIKLLQTKNQNSEVILRGQDPTSYCYDYKVEDAEIEYDDEYWNEEYDMELEGDECVLIIKIDC